MISLRADRWVNAGVIQCSTITARDGPLDPPDSGGDGGYLVFLLGTRRGCALAVGVAAAAPPTPIGHDRSTGVLDDQSRIGERGQVYAASRFDTGRVALRRVGPG